MMMVMVMMTTKHAILQWKSRPRLRKRYLRASRAQRRTM